MGAVGGDAVPFQPGQQDRRRQLHVVQQPGGADFLQPLAERVAEVEHGAGLGHQGLGLGLLVRTEGELAVGRGSRGELPAQILHGQGLQCEGTPTRLHQIGGERGVHRDALDAPPVLGEDPHRVLRVVHDLGALRVRDPGGEGLLVGLVQLGRVEPGGRPLRRGERDLADTAGAQRPALDGGHAQRLPAVLGQPGCQLPGSQHGAVQLHSGGRGLRGFVRRARVDGQQPLAQARVPDLQHIQHVRERLPVVRGALQVRRALRQLDVTDHLGEPHG